MTMEITLVMGVFILLMAFLCEYMDASLGMGFGTTLTPVMLMIGFSPLQIVPAILVSELFTGLLAAALHHRQGNVDLRPKTLDPRRIFRSLVTVGSKESFQRGVPLHLKVALLLTACSTIGTVAAVLVALNIPRFYLKMYIGVLVLTMGILILVFLKKNFAFSWYRMTFLGTIASFNKGMSGGGYGPLVTGGQILSGLQCANAVAITSLAEGLTCLVGVITYSLVQKSAMDWTLVPWLAAGALISVPFSTITVKKINPQTLKLAIGIFTIVLGGFTIIKTVL